MCEGLGFEGREGCQDLQLPNVFVLFRRYRGTSRGLDYFGWAGVSCKSFGCRVDGGMGWDEWVAECKRWEDRLGVGGRCIRFLFHDTVIDEGVFVLEVLWV